MSLLSTFNFLLSTIAYGDTHAAGTCSVSDVQSAVNAASDGDTVAVPAGNSTWNSAVSITNKTIILQGAGSGSGGTKITYGGTGHTLISIDAGTKTGKMDISGFWFSGGDGQANEWNGTAMQFRGPKGWKNLRIHHNLFDGNYPWTMKGYSSIQGLIDHNTFQGNAFGIMLYGDSQTDWSTPLVLGTADFFFIEDNIFNWNPWYGSSGVPVMDMDSGGRQVFRYNTAKYAMWETHDKARSGLVSANAYEIYNNTFLTDASYSIHKGIDASAGTGVIWGNTITGYNIPIGAIDYKSFDPRSCKLCDGTDSADQNVAGQSGWRCQYQIGTQGEGATAYSYPLYLWNNKTASGNSVGMSCTAGQGCNHVQENRDYYNNGTTPKPGYTPYTYPHPLQGAAPSDTTPPQGIAAVNDGTGSDIASTILTTQLSANWTASTDPESGILGYKYAIGTSAGGTQTTGAWTTLGNVLTVTRSGLSLTVGTTYYFSVKAFNGAMLESAAANSNGQFVRGDTTPPVAPSAVRDGTGADISSTLSATQLSANWDAAVDAESGIAKYYYAIGTSAGSSNVVNWTDNGTGLSVARTGLSLTTGTTYYFSVKAQNTVGLQGPARNSNGQVLLQTPQDTTPPTSITTVNDGTGADIDSTASLTQLSANWTAAADAQSGISGYKYAIGTTAGATNTLGWTLLGSVTSVTKTALSLTAGTTYYFSVKAVNGVDLESVSAMSSDGICVTAQGGSGTGTAVISGVDVTNLTDRSATIIWDTDLDTRGQVQYGTTLNYIGGEEETATGKRHMIDIKSLDPETRYHYKVLNIDGNGNTTESSDYTFKTYALIARPMPIVGKVYPNPYKLADTAQMTFALSSAAGGSIKIYTLSGKLVKNISVTSGSTDALWNLTNEAGNRINGGLYVYIMSDSDGNKKTGKIVITN
jgi:hypothetical protein